MLGIGRGTRDFLPWEFRPRLQDVDKEPSSNDPFPEADVAVIIMDRFVIKPVFARPTNRYQLVGDPIRLPSSAFDHQLKWQKDQDLPSVWDQNPILYNCTNSVQMVARSTCLPAPTTPRFGPTTRDQAQCDAICAFDH